MFHLAGCSLIKHALSFHQFFLAIVCLTSHEADTIASVHVNTLPQYAERLINTEPVDAGLSQSVYTLLA